MPYFDITVYKEVRTVIRADGSNAKEAIEKAHEMAQANPNEYKWDEVPDSHTTDEGLDVVLVNVPVQEKVAATGIKNLGDMAFANYPVPPAAGRVRRI